MDYQLKTISLADINFGERRREDYGDIEELANDIKAKGIISPLAVMQQPGKDDGTNYLLLAGGRRYRASTHAGLDEVPARIYPESLTTLEVRSIELSENVNRKDFTWQERINLEKEIHDLHIKMKGEKVGKSSTSLGHTIKDTAAIVGRSAESVRQNLKLAATVEQFPDLFDKCKNQSEATKVAGQLEEKIILEELASRAKANPKVQSNKLSKLYIVGDCIEGMKKIPKGSINLVEIDPPYSIDLEKAKMDFTYSGAYAEIAESKYEIFCRELLDASYKAMSDHSWLIFWFGPEPWFEDIYSWIIDAGFNCKRMCGIWTKSQAQSMRPETNLANSYEMFFYASKGKPILQKQGRRNIFDTPPVPANKKVHPTERPIELMKEIYSTFTHSGSRVAIPCLGSGNGILAADELDMAPIGFDVVEKNRDNFLLKLKC